MSRPWTATQSVVELWQNVLMFRMQRQMTLRCAVVSLSVVLLLSSSGALQLSPCSSSIFLYVSDKFSLSLSLSTRHTQYRVSKCNKADSHFVSSDSQHNPNTVPYKSEKDSCTCDFPHVVLSHRHFISVVFIEKGSNKHMHHCRTAHKQRLAVSW